jgi:FtsH-binding integral membrane protein
MSQADPVVLESTFAVLMRKVYVWMTLALAVTGLTAYGVASSPSLLNMIFSNQAVFWVLAIVELGLVIGLSAAIGRMSFTTAALMFIIYSIVNGVTMSLIFIAYTMSSIALTFFITAGTFAGMAAVGYFIKKDLSAMGKFLMFALIGVIIASVVHIFLKSSGLEFGISIVGVLLFAGLTAYDSQKIKDMLMQTGGEVNDTTQKIALMGSLSLYLDFINLFLYLLRFLGKARE